MAVAAPDGGDTGSALVSLAAKAAIEQVVGIQRNAATGEGTLETRGVIEFAVDGHARSGDELTEEKKTRVQEREMNDTTKKKESRTPAPYLATGRAGLQK